MTPSDQTALFIAILSGHKGLAQAISVADMAGRLNVSTRQAQKIKELVVERGMLVGSSCGKSHGWYAPATQQEIQATLGNYKARIRSLARTIRYTEGAAGFSKFVGELALEFEQEVTL
jgi:hypothetical protein